MKILIIAPYYAPSSEVPSVRMVSLTNTLLKNGHNVTAVCYSREQLLQIYQPDELRTTIPSGVKSVGFELNGKNVPYVTDIINGIRFKRILLKKINPLDFDVAFTSCGPYFTLEVMPILKSRYGLPYVLDFRDLGAINYRPQLQTECKTTKFWKRPLKSLYRTLARKREYRAISKADTVICVSEIDKEKMKDIYCIPEDKLVVATNGFDEDKLSAVVPGERKKGIIVAVFGKFMYYSKERATAILKAIDSLRKEGVDISLIHIGKSYEWIAETIKKEKIDPSSYCALGLREYSEGMSLLGAADFFVVEDTSPDDVGTKIYDYIYWNKPIVAAVPSNIPLAKLVGSFEHGYICDNNEKVNLAIRDIVKEKYSYLDSALNVDVYSRKYQNEKMMNVLNAICAKSKGDYGGIKNI